MSKLKRSLAFLLSALMVFCFVPFSSFAAETAADDTVPAVSKSANGLTIAKSVSMDDSGQFVLDIEGYATGTSSTVTKSTPLDIVLLIDVSGSMGDSLNGFENYKKDQPNSSGKYAYSYDNVRGKYAYYNGNYYQVNRERSGNYGNYRYSAYITVNRQRVYLTANGFSTTEAEYASSGATLWTDELYARETSKLAATKIAINNFIESVNKDAVANNVDHKIALVTYASDASVKNNLLEVSKNKAALETTVNGLTSGGATAIDYGFDQIGQNIFTSSYLDSNKDRSQVVIAFTDGEPNHYNNFDSDVANTALKDSNNLKKKGVIVYSIGLGLKSGDPTDFMDYLSSNYLKTQRANFWDSDDPTMSHPGNRLTGGNYSSLVTDAEGLNSVFQNISEEIISSESSVDDEAVLTDTITQYFNIAETGILEKNPDYTVKKLACTGADSAGDPKWQSWDAGTVLTDVKVTVGEDDTITATGFDYTAKENIVVPSKPAGNKLVIRVKLDVDPDQLSEGRTLAPTNETADKKAAIIDKEGVTAIELDKSPVVDLYKVAVTGDSKTVKYSGSEQSVNTYSTTADFAVEGLSYSAKGTDAGNYAGAFTGKINKVTYKGTDVTKKTFWSDPTAGSLTINKRDVTLTSADGTWTYDGKAHSSETVTPGGDGFVSGEGASYSGFPSVKTVADTGTDGIPNKFDYELNSNTKAGNYNFTQEYGVLKITQADDLKLDVEKSEYSGKYDGASHGEAAVPSETDGTVVEYSIDGGKNWTEEVPKVTDVADTAAVKVRATNPNYSNTAEAEYTLEVTKRKVTMTSADGSWTYDKQEHQAADVTEGGADGFIEGEGADYSNFASIKNVLESDVSNTFEYALNEKAKADNYEIEVIPGKLSITKADPLTLDVTGSSYLGVYDGKAHGEAAVPSETDGTTVEYSVDGGDWTTEVPKITNVGKNTVKARATNPNYKDGDPAEYTLEVTPKDVTVTPDPAQKTYGEPDPELTATVTGVIDGEDPSQIKYDLEREEGELVGDYTIKASGDEDQGNYKVTFEEGTLTIGKLILDEENHFAYIIGYPDGTVGAEKSITRAEAATIFFRLLEKNSREGAKAGAREFVKENSFKDVKDPNAWYYNAVYVLASNGIINGYPGKKGECEFKPNDPITRAEFATIASKFKTLEGGEAPFTDISGHWAEKYIISAYAHGWINGYEEDNTFRPDNKIKRAEVANIVNNVLNRLVDKTLKEYSDPIDPEKMFVSPEASAEIQAAWNKWSDNNPSDWFYVTIQEATNAHDYSITKGTTDPTDLIEKWTKLRENENWAAIQSPDWLNS